jgi:hypothetical protein
MTYNESMTSSLEDALFCFDLHIDWLSDALSPSLARTVRLSRSEGNILLVGVKGRDIL